MELCFVVIIEGIADFISKYAIIRVIQEKVKLKSSTKGLNFDLKLFKEITLWSRLKCSSVHDILF